MEHRIQAKLRVSGTQKRVWFVAMGAALWGIVPPFRALILKSITSMQFVLVEHLMLALYAIPILWIQRKQLRRCTWNHILALLFISWGGSVWATIMFTEAYAHGNPNGVLLLQKLQPLFALIMARFILKEKLPGHFLPLLLMALVGAYLLTLQDNTSWEFPFHHYNEIMGMGSLLALGAAILWGCSTVIGRFLLRTMDYETVTSLRFLLAVPLLVVLTMVEASGWSNPLSEWRTLTFHIFLQALLVLIGILLYYRGLSRTKASYATLAELSLPIAGLFTNWIVLGEGVTGAQITGFLLIWIVLYRISKQDG